jgi:addiction module RelB/DinJ family antitoxin
MPTLSRSDALQTRINPQVKRASKVILGRLGMNLSDAIDFFLRRVIVDERLPFEIVALDDATLTRIATELEGKPLIEGKSTGRRSGKLQNREKGVPTKKRI